MNSPPDQRIPCRSIIYPTSNMTKTAKAPKAKAAKKAPPRPKGSSSTMSGMSRSQSAPLAKSTATSSKGASIQSFGSGRESSIRVRHREFLGSYDPATTAFSARFSQINPGLAQNFPWLSQLAAAWEQYKFVKLVYDFVSRSPATKGGSFAMSVDYDASDPLAESLGELLNRQNSVESSVWTNLRCTLAPKSMHALGQRKFVRDGNRPGDIKTYDVGTITFASEGLTDTTAPGLLFVEYDVELSVPVADTAVSCTTLSRIYSRTAAADVALNDTTYTTLTPPAVQFRRLGDTRDCNALQFLTDNENSMIQVTGPKGSYRLTGIIGVVITNTDATDTEIASVRVDVTNGTGASPFGYPTSVSATVLGESASAVTLPIDFIIEFDGSTGGTVNVKTDAIIVTDPGDNMLAAITTVVLTVEAV